MKMGDFKQGKSEEVNQEVKYKDVPGEDVKRQEVKVKDDTYAKVKRRANIEGLVDPELARILFFLPIQAQIYIRVYDFFLNLHENNMILCCGKNY